MRYNPEGLGEITFFLLDWEEDGSMGSVAVPVNATNATYSYATLTPSEGESERSIVLNEKMWSSQKAIIRRKRGAEERKRKGRRRGEGREVGREGRQREEKILEGD